MSNAKRIQKKIQKIEMQKHKRFFYYISKIDTRPVAEALEKLNESIIEVVHSVKKIRYNNELL